MGIKPDVEVDVQELPYEKEDRFLLCTDGIHGTMPETELIKMTTNRRNALAAVTDDIATFVDNMGRSSGGGHDNLTLAIIELKINSNLKPQMSKLTKIIILALATISVISVAINIIQVTNSRSNVYEKTINSLEYANDSLLHVNDSLLSANGSLRHANDSLGKVLKEKSRAN